MSLLAPRPLIALPSRLSESADTWRVPVTALGRPYQEAIARAGGIPVAVPPLFGAAAEAEAVATAVIARVDGLCLPGGPDVGPHRYGATHVHVKVYGVRDEHDELDLALARAAIARGIPMLAICRGHQILNVALGGTLHQHLAEHVGAETAADHDRRVHELKVEGGTRTAAALGTDTPVGHCVHHQAVDALAPGLVPTAWCGAVLEGFETGDPSRWVVGVQWHPEDTAAADAEQQGLFDAFVAAARRSVS